MIKWRRGPRATWTEADPDVVDALAPEGVERPEGTDPVAWALSMGEEDAASALPVPARAEQVQGAAPRRGLLMDDLAAVFDAMPAVASVRTLGAEAVGEPVDVQPELLERRGEDVIVYGWGDAEQEPIAAEEAGGEIALDVSEELEAIGAPERSPEALDEELRRALGVLECEDYRPAPGAPGDEDEPPEDGFELEIIDYELTGGNPIDDEADWGALEFQSGRSDPRGWVNTRGRPSPALEQVKLPEAAGEGSPEEGPLPIAPEDLELIEEGSPARDGVVRSSKILSRTLSVCSFEEHLASLDGPALDPVHLYLRSGLPVAEAPERRPILAAILKARCDFAYYKPLVPEGLAGHFRGYYTTFRECLHHLEQHVPPRGEEALSAAWDEAWVQIEGALPPAERQRRVA